MKRIPIVLALLLISTAAWTDTLKWNASPTADGYKVYYNEYSKIVGDVTECVLEEIGTVPGTEYTIHTTAYNSAGESEPSNSVTWTRPVYTPTDNPAPTVIIIPGPVTINVQ